MLNTRRVFVRHGQSLHNVGLSEDYDSALTPEGAEQVRRAGRYLAGQKYCQKLRGYVSPLRRALETARIIRAEAGVEFVVEPRVREWPFEVPPELRRAESHRLDFPEFTWHDLGKRFDWTGVEGRDYVGDLEGFVRGEMAPHALVVSHQTTIEQMIFMAATPGSLPSRRFYNIDNASVTVLEDGLPLLLGHGVGG